MIGQRATLKRIGVNAALSEGVAMERRPPKPICKLFVLCREVFYDPVRQTYAIVSPVHQVVSPRFPIQEQLAIFARWSSAHGLYELGIELRTLEGEVIWRATLQDPLKVTNPLHIWLVPIYRFVVNIPAPGKYEIALLANGEEVACDDLIARFPQDHPHGTTEPPPD